MNLLHLRYFQTVAEIEHMSEAAKQLNLAQPALSQVIAKIEQHVGVPLFDRVGRHIRLNAYGKIYLRQVNLALMNLADGEREIAERSGVQSNQIALAVTSMNHLSHLLVPYLADHPDVHFHIIQASMEHEKLAHLERNEIDFFLTTEQISDDRVTHVPLFTDDICLVVSRQHPLAQSGHVRLSDAAKERFVALKQGYAFRHLTDALCQAAGFEPIMVCEGDEPAALGTLVKAGLGIAFMPAASQIDHPELVYLPIVDPISSMTYYLVSQHARFHSSLAMSFREYVIAYYQKLQAHKAEDNPST